MVARRYAMQRATYAIMAVAVFGAMPNHAFGQSKYDGIWSILVVTQQGKCDKAYKYVVRMDNGEVKNQGKFEITGSISANGRINGTIIRRNSKNPNAPTRVVFAGVVAANSGSGTWTGTSNGGCSGYWDANRGTTLGMMPSWWYVEPCLSHHVPATKVLDFPICRLTEGERLLPGAV
jgi:hypothetical protein